jgi:hypothetical protein
VSTEWIILRKDADDGHWRDQGGRVDISLDPTFETECNAPHPVRMLTKNMTRHHHLAAQSNGGRTRGRHTSWQCPGGETHFYSQWTAMLDGDWTPDVYDTLAQARADIERITGQRVRLAPTYRKERP